MTDTLTHPKPTAWPMALVVVALVVALAIAVVMAVGTWITGGSDGSTPSSPRPATTWVCEPASPC